MENSFLHQNENSDLDLSFDFNRNNKKTSIPADSEPELDRQKILELLNILKNGSFEEKIKYVYRPADEIRKKNTGDEVFIRGIIEFSNYCRNNCFYCGLRCENKKTERYRISDEEIIDICMNLKKTVVGTVVLQSGEDYYYTKEKFGNLIKQIKLKTKLAITVSVGERDIDTYKYWKDCGMDRYLIRFETTNRKIFKKIHPDSEYDYRINCIKNLKRIGIQTGSGFMIGLPGSNENDIAEDILFCRELNLDMIGVGPFISNPDTPLKNIENKYDVDFLTGIISLLRIANPKSHIPATTAFDALDKNGRQLCLTRGANVFMPNITPQKYRLNYLLYPNKPCVDEDVLKCMNCLNKRIESINRIIGRGRGDSLLRFSPVEKHTG